MKRVFACVGVAAALGFGSVSVSAATYEFVEKLSGNDCAGVLGSPFAECQYPAAPAEGSPIIAKFDLNENGTFSGQVNSDVFGSNVLASMFQVLVTPSTGSTKGTWSYDGTTVAITHFVLKAGDEFAVFKMTPSGTDFTNVSWDTALGFLTNNQGAAQALSHISFYDTRVPQEVPIPAAAWLLGSGLLAMGAIGRRRMSARV